jgi:hypothetical protein
MTLRTITWKIAGFTLFSVFGTACKTCELEPFCGANGDDCSATPPNTDTPPGTTTGSDGAGGQSTSSGSGGSGGASAETTLGGEGGFNEGGAGGAASCDPAQTTCPCEADSTCAEPGRQCVNGLCVDASCSFSYECGAGKVCANGACVSGCGDSTPCATGYRCDKGICRVDPNNPTCSPEQPCVGEGLRCEDGLCVTACTTNAECGAGLLCDASIGACVPDPTPKPGCNADKPCMGAGQECKDDGYCHYPCGTLTDCKLIDSRFAVCGGSVCMTQSEANPECTFDHPCPNGQDCISNKCM